MELEQLMRCGAVHACVAEVDTHKLSKAMGAKLSSTLSRSMHSEHLNQPIITPLLTPKVEQWVARLRNAGDSNRHSEILEFLMTTAREVLGLPATTRLDMRQPLRELGLDSLMAVEMKNVLSDVTQLSLDTTVLFDYPTIEALAKLLNDRLSARSPVNNVHGKIEVDAKSDTANEDVAVQLANALASLRLNDSHSS
jgi:acyl carrier protein